MTFCSQYAPSQAMFNAVRDLALDPEKCEIAGSIFGYGEVDPRVDPRIRLRNPGTEMEYSLRLQLNASQNTAVEAVTRFPITCLWGPPGTGKTHTIVEIIHELQIRYPESRILVTAPSHNAVDNVMRRYLVSLSSRSGERSESGGAQWQPLRVSNDVCKVSTDLRNYTVDSMTGHEIHTNHEAMRKARKMVKNARIIFSTCIGSGIGLMRSESFQLVIIDESSQQTEPASLVPLTRGCALAVLVGDHVQLRPTVQPEAAALGFDVSLFERLYTEKLSKERLSTLGIRKIMLDTQYRMHRQICSFPSSEFYGGTLQTGIDQNTRPMFPSTFPWPRMNLLAQTTQTKGLSDKDTKRDAVSRMVFVQCKTPEDLGQKSKSNQGQADLCFRICQLLSQVPTSTESESRETNNNLTRSPKPTVAILTPYTRQVQLLQKKLVGLSLDIEISSIDGFQGKEADIVIFVTVRCNLRGEIGFLKDQRRLNVALTRAKTGLIVIGNRATLTSPGVDPESAGLWKRLLAAMSEVQIA